MHHFRKKAPILAVTALVLLFAMLLSSLAHTDGAPQEDGRLCVVTTTTMLADLANVIGGEHVRVTGLMGPGIDPHLYKAGAGDVIRLQEADVVVFHGLHLEGKMADIFPALQARGCAVVCISDGIDPQKLIRAADGSDLYDPHIWFDVPLWADAARHLTAQFCEADPARAQSYRENLAAYLLELAQLDCYIRDRAAELSQKQRVLITAHDAFRYFGAAYGFEVHGLQGISTNAQAGTADVSGLAALIAQRQIKAVFVESSVPPKSMEALQAAVNARGFSVAPGGELHSDALGDAQSGSETYLLTVKANVDTIVDALK